MFNPNAIAAINSGKQYTNTYCKNNNIAESLSWSALSRTQKKIYKMVEAGGTLIDADPSLALFNSHLDEYRAVLEKYLSILNGETSAIVSNAAIYILVNGSRRFRAKDGELEEDLKGGFGKWLQIVLYRDSRPVPVTRETAEACFEMAKKDPVKTKKSKSKSKSKTYMVDPAKLSAIAIRLCHGDQTAQADLDALLALAAD